MRFSRLVRAPDCQFQSRNSLLGSIPILASSDTVEFQGAAYDAVSKKYVH